MPVGGLQQRTLFISFLAEGEFNSDPPFSWLGGEVIGKDLNWLGGSSPTFRNFNPNLEQTLGFDPNKESDVTGSSNGGGNGSNGEGSDGTASNGGSDGTTSNGDTTGSSSTTKKYYVMVSHHLEGGFNTWNLIRYNHSSNGAITLERKSPHYICEFESFNITGQKTATITTKLKTDLKIKVKFHLLAQKYILILRCGGITVSRVKSCSTPGTRWNKVESR